MNVLFVCYGGGHVNIVIPIVKRLKETTNFNVTVLGLTTAKHKLEEEGISSIGFKDIVDDSADERAIKIGEKLSLGISNSYVSHEETAAYLGLSYVDLENRYSINEAKNMYDQMGRKAFLPITVLERLFTKIKPDLVVATSSPRAEQAAIIAAGNMNIPSICVLDWFVYLKSDCGWVSDDGYANKICVLSETVKKGLIKEGRKSEEIMVTGNPAFDYLANREYYDNGMKFRIKNGWSNKKVLLWASQQEPNNLSLPRKIEEQLLKIISKYDDYQLVIRFHPNEEVKLENLPSNVYISKNSEDLIVLLNSIDIVITMTSTLGLEAVMLDKPLITVDMSEFTINAPFCKLGLSIGVKNLDELEDAIIKGLSNKEKKDNDLIPKPGEAAGNIVQVIKDILLTKS